MTVVSHAHDASRMQSTQENVQDDEAHGSDQSPARRRGSSASRKPSPKRLNPSTVTKIATPGKVATHHAEARNCRPSTIMLPQLGSGGWAPSPRYDSPDSMRIVWPSRRV